VIPRSEEFMGEARSALGAASVLVERRFASPAVSEAYHAILYAARAALSERDRYAKTRAGTLALFNQLFVAEGSFDPELARAASSIQERRERVDYEAASVPEDEATSIVDAAEQFVAAVDEMFE
jgi:uncharacterized protein (UPF0332 family)